MTAKPLYPSVDSSANFAAIEEAVLAFWKEDGTFEKSVENRAAVVGGKSNAFVFYDGPPFANGLPHYGHLLTGYVKDAIARYQTMRGKRVERRFGWDCHGLPAEMGAEKELGISGRAAIAGYGIDKFNAHCKTSVMKYTADWEYYVNRQGRWVDFKNDYKTMDKNFMESCLWAFKKLYNKGLIYESMRVMPYSWAAETPVSNFETRIDNATREREDKAAFVKFKLKEKPAGAPEAKNYYLIAWTTTPWTLPSNLSLAVNKEMLYTWVKLDEETVVCGTDKFVLKMYGDILQPYVRDLESPKIEQSIEIQKTIHGKDLIGLSYEPLFPYFANTPNAFRVLDGSEFVTDGDGTGIVHMAPGFGEVDQQCCVKNGIEVVVPVDEKGRFTSDIFDVMLESERLTLRAFTEGDYPLYQALQADPEVAKTTSDGVLPEEKIRAEFNRILADQLRNGFTQWAVFRKEDGAFIGRAGFDDRDYLQFNTTGKPAYELRYALLSNFWGKGYATEVSTVLMDWAGMHLNVPLIIAGCNPTYDAAVKLLKKLGFDAHHEVPYKNQPVLYHTQEMDAWKARRGTVTPVAKTLSLADLVVVPDSRIAEADIVVNDEDKAQHIAAKDVFKYGIANMRIVRWLKAHGKLVKDEPYKHNYPHCWRTDTPLIYRAMGSWYVNVQQVKANMVANNQTITWIPDHVQSGQMGKGIESAPDWSISRNRFWGTPIPIWKSESGKIHVCGSIEEIEKLSGQKVDDLHRPFIDNVVLKIDGEEYTRIEDVFDCWFESGSMPFAQLHYPFENKQQFEENFPADFITEYIAQTRGWFYTLQVLSAALFEKAPFKNCICHGVVIDEETGLKYSKRLKNYKDPKEVMDQFGADALRWMMLASPVMRGSDLGVDPDGKFIRDVVRLNIKPLWNAYHFFTLYANADGVQAKPVERSLNALDAYILAKCKAAVQQVQTSLDAYDTPGATEAITGFFEVLNNWYIRRSRARFWAEEKSDDKQAAYDTLYTVLTIMCRAAAPLLPFVSEAVYRGLVGEGSVHLTDFPDVSGIDSAEQLVADMDRVRDACTAMLFIRNQENVRIRQPLASATIYGSGAGNLNQYASLISEELNVKEIKFSESLSDVAEFVLTINFPIAGKRLGGRMKEIAAAAKAGNWKAEGPVVTVAGEVMQVGEYTLQIKPLTKGAQGLSTNDAVVALDLTITPELEAEGNARDLVRMIQQARKDAGLNVADRIALTIEAPALSNAIDLFGDYIATQTLAKIEKAPLAKADFSATQDVEGHSVTIQLAKAA